MWSYMVDYLLPCWILKEGSIGEKQEKEMGCVFRKDNKETMIRKKKPTCF